MVGTALKKTSQAESSSRGSSNESKLPRRDWVLLPLLSLLTFYLVCHSAKWLAWRLFAGSPGQTETCLMTNDASTGVRGIPNSRCFHKELESSGPIEYRFDACGYRSALPCGPKPPSVFRIVLVGSSVSMGLRVPIEQTFSALLPHELSRLTGRKIELYNEGMQWGTPGSVDLRFNDVLAAQPDLILWPITPWDIQFISMPLLPGAPEWEQVRQEDSQGRRRSWFPDFTNGRTVFLLRHFLYLSESQYVKHYLMQGEGAAFLKAVPDAVWADHLRQFELYAASVTGKAAAAGIPLVVTVLPQRAQAALISVGTWPSGLDPYAVGDEVRSIVLKHGGAYVDVLRGFRNVANAEQYYLPIDEHPDATAHAIFSRLLSRALTSGAVPALNPAPVLKAANSQANR